MRKFTLEAVGMGTNNTGYAGAFPPAIQDLIKKTVAGKVLHLFSGSSLIGDERVDIGHKNATMHTDIRTFIKTDCRNWDFVILDPPYAIIRAETKLASYGIDKALSSDVIFRRQLTLWLAKHTNNVLWLDFCAPTIKGFKREKVWLVLPGGFHTVRVLSWLKKEQELLL